MLKLSKIQIDERIEKLSPILKEALFDYENFIKIETIEKNFNLNDSQSKIFGKIIGRVIMGFIPLSDLEKEIISGLALSQEDAKKISDTLNHEILVSLKGEIEKIGQSRAPQTPIPPENVVNLKKVPVVSPLNKIIFTEKKSAEVVNPNESSKPLPPVFDKEISPAPKPFSPSSSPKSASPLPAPKPLEQIFPKSSPFPSPSPSSASLVKPATPPIVNNFSLKNTAPIQKDFIRPVSPFIIHEESKVEPVFRSDVIEKKATPEMSSPFFSKDTKQEAVVARVEIGKTRREERKEKTVSPVTARTEQEKRKAIDYSVFSSGPVDPFSKIKSVSMDPVPAPDKKEEKPLPSSGPSLKGNVVDFRE
ncbi:MAG: hypothetical protein PHZ25_00575 [Candidatus Pacebacteria bacterium]|nr:hypothetical protein [Candidatus Paceibacterota bacterium]